MFLTFQMNQDTTSQWKNDEKDRRFCCVTLCAAFHHILCRQFNILSHFSHHCSFQVAFRVSVSAEPVDVTARARTALSHRINRFGSLDGCLCFSLPMSVRILQTKPKNADSETTTSWCTRCVACTRNGGQLKKKNFDSRMCVCCNHPGRKSYTHGIYVLNHHVLAPYTKKSRQTTRVWQALLFGTLFIRCGEK